MKKYTVYQVDWHKCHTERKQLWGYGNPVVVFGRSPLQALSGNMQMGATQKDKVVEITDSDEDIWATYLVTDGVNDYFFTMESYLYDE